MTDIHFQIIPASDHFLLNQIERTYVDSFPEEERRDFLLVRELIDTNPLFTMIALLHVGAYIGFISYWTFEGFRYIEHFSIDPAARNGGFGGRALKKLLAQEDKPVVLEVELPADEWSRRRVSFYERLGFILDDQPYYQPSYHDPQDPPLEMRLMTWGDLSLKQSFTQIVRQIHATVYGV